MLSIYDENYCFYSFFNPQNGFYLRTGILNEHMMDTGDEAPRASFPHLIDVGVMGTCAHGKQGLCNASGNYCYQSGSSIEKNNMSIEFFSRLAFECKGRTFQFALGGRGDPNQHEDFEKILRVSRDNHIVPNYTTSGYQLTNQQVELSLEYCGSVAVSWYNQPYSYAAVDAFFSKGKPVNLHFVISDKSIGSALELLDQTEVLEKVHAIIFLLYKPIGEGNHCDVLSVNNPLLPAFLSRVSKVKQVKIRFDSCFIPTLLKCQFPVPTICLDACEGGRYSCYIDAEGYMYPCSFIQSKDFMVNINKSCIETGWNSQKFLNFLEISDSKKCNKTCPAYTICRGGCPVIEQINLCGGSSI